MIIICTMSYEKRPPYFVDAGAYLGLFHMTIIFRCYVLTLTRQAISFTIKLT